MIFEVHHIALLGIAYLSFLFGVAYIANHGWLPKRFTSHPATYVLSLGIFFSAWSFYGTIELASEFGYGALAYYLGTGAFFLFAPIIQAPLAELSQRFQLRSIADLLVFRYQHQFAGSLATLFIAFALLPLLVLQLQAVADTMMLLTHSLPEDEAASAKWEQSRGVFAFLYCVVIGIFCMIYGAGGFGQYRALITTMAFESTIKLLAFLTVGIFSIYGVFGGFAELDLWLLNNPEHYDQLYNPPGGLSSHSLLLVFIATGVLMPHVFLMSEMGKSVHQVANMLTWTFPLFLLVMAIPIFPILWAGLELGVPFAESYFPIGVPQYANAPAVTLIGWIGGLSAASGALVVSIMSLTTMILNQWVLPIARLRASRDIYAQLRWMRRTLVLIILSVVYLLYLFLNESYSLMDLALMAFIQALQFVPGVLAISYWPRATHSGFFAGITAGSLIWFFGLALPVFLAWETLTIPYTEIAFPIGIDSWEAISLIALAVNITFFVAVSYLTPLKDEELYHAEICSDDGLSRPFRRVMDVNSTQDFIDKLTVSIGRTAAEKEVTRALVYLGLSESETRPYALRRLRTRIRTNLAGLMGHRMAAELVEKHFPYNMPHEKEVFDINLMENRLERLGDKMKGLTADVNHLRIHHRTTLKELPVPICSLGLDDEILLWNNAMSELTGISDADITGSNLSVLPEPWGPLISEFANDSNILINKQSIDHSGNTNWFRLHKSAIAESNHSKIEGLVIVIEDITDIQQMEQELIHNARLASIGRLAAGVAHEIGNPVTGIACLAQNLRYEEEENERQETAKQILSQTDRITRIVQSLVTFAHSGRSQPKDFQQVVVNTCIGEAIHLLSLQQDRKPIEYRNLCPTDLLVAGDSQRLIQVFINLLSNAHDASPEYSTVTIYGSTEGNKAIIEIIDEGTGIDPELADLVMEPFFTTKDPGKGTGLGLSMVFNIIEEHNGEVKITSPVSNDRGTCFTITLPLPAMS